VYVIKLIIFLLLLSGTVSITRAQVRTVPVKPKDTVVIKVDSLKPAIVTAVLRPHMKGDTLEYNTEHIHMEANTVVEELLRRLPGLYVAPDGTITYNGEKIDHLLVDGVDIFGSDPTLVTRSFDADKISRVQILDRRSEQTLFTGIDDGTRTKTLNLVLKEDARNGYFGKVEAGANTDRLYNVSGAVAGFRNKEQLTFIGMGANTGVLGSNLSAGGDIGFLYGISDPLGASAGGGVPYYTAGAVHYANTWNGSSDHAEGNYQYSHYYSQPVATTESSQAQLDSIYGQYQQSHSTNSQQQQWVDARYDWGPNTHSTFRVKVRASTTQEHNQFIASGNSTFNDTLVNSSVRTIQDEMNRRYTSGALDWRTQIGRNTGRVFSITSECRMIDATTNGYLYSLDQFYQSNGQMQSADTTNQRKQIATHSRNINGSFNFSEPLWTGTTLGFSYGLNFTTDHPLQGTYDRGHGDYETIVDSLSSYLKTQTIDQRATLSLQVNTRHMTYTFGNDWIGYSYQQHDLIADSVLHQHYANWAPRLLVNYAANTNTNVSFNYQASTQEPSIMQLVPITNNNNPLYITLGNPDLKPALNQTFDVNYQRFKTWRINLGLNLNLSGNSITTKTTTDSLGRQISQPVNVQGGKSGRVNFSLNREIEGINFNIHTVGAITQSVTYVNADLSRNNAVTGGGGFGAYKYLAGKYNFQLNSNFVYFSQVSSINVSAPVHYWIQNHDVALTIYLIEDFELNTSTTFTWQEKTSAFASSTSVLLWNSYISRNFLHKRLVSKIQFNNILNQNTGVSRSTIGNSNMQSSTNILGRYWMISVIYHFDRKFKQK
jgi:hypothetical protein